MSPSNPVTMQSGDSFHHAHACAGGLGVSGQAGARVRERYGSIHPKSRLTNAPLVPEAVLLCFGGELVEHLLAPSLVALLIRQKIGSLHTAVRADHTKRNLAVSE